MQNFIGGLFRFIIKLVLTVFGLLLALGLLLLALMVVVLSFLKALATGKKPAPVAVFGKFQTFRSGNLWSGNTRAAPQADVVDVEVREVKETMGKNQLPQDPR